MLLFRQHSRDATSFEAGQAFHFGVPSCEPAFEEDRCGRDVILVGTIEGALGGVPEGVAAKGCNIVSERSSFLDVVFGDMVSAGMAEGFHDE